MTKHPNSRDVRGTKNPRWRPVMERFWEKVDRSGVCWTWMGYTNKAGYGLFKVDGKAVLVHRYLMNASDGVCVLHTCDNPPRVNPNHLYIGDRKQNAYDRDSRGRNGFQLLNNSQILEIYSSDETQETLADKFDTSLSVVGRIKRGDSYRWLTNPLSEEATNRGLDRAHR